MSRRNHRRNIMLAAAVAGLVQAGTAPAATHTWNGSTDLLWGTAANWSSGVVPNGTSEDVVFNTLGASVGTIDTSVGTLSIRSLTFNADAVSPVIISVDPSRTFTINGQTGDDVIVQAGTHVIRGTGAATTTELRLNATDFNIAPGASLELAARVNQNSTANSYSLGGGGTLIISAQNGSTGGWNFTGGAFNINNGAVVMRTTQAMGNSANRVNIGSSGALQFEAGTYVAVAGTISLADGAKLRTISGNRLLGAGAGAVLLNGNGVIDAQGGSFIVTQDLAGAGGFTKTGAGTLVLGDGGANTASSYSGVTTIAAGTLALGNATITTGSTGNSSLVNVQSGAAFNVNPVGGYTVHNNQTLAGNGSVYGNVTLGSDGTIAPGLRGAAGTLSLANDLTVSGGQLHVDLTSPGIGGANDVLAVGGNLNLNSPVALNVNRLGGSLAAGSYTVLTYGGTLSGSPGNLVAPVVRQGLTVDTSTAGQVNLVLGAGSAADLLWKGSGSSSAWQTNGANVWDNSGAADKYYDWDNVTFSDDHAGNSTSIDVTGVVLPNNVLVNNSSASNYTFGGSGTIAGVNVIAKQGSGIATFSNAGGLQAANLASVGGVLVLASPANIGSVTIAGGTVVVTGSSNFGATNISSGTLGIGDGSNVASIGAAPVTNNGWLVLNNPGDSSYATSVSGTGVIEKLGSGVATFTGNNSSHTGTILVSAGTLKANNNNALAAGGGTLVVANGAAVDLNAGGGTDSLTFGAKVFHIQGAGTGSGAIVNSGVIRQFSAFQFITLDDDATIGGFRFDIGRNGTGDVLDLAGHKLTTSFSGALPMFGIQQNATVTSGTIEVAAGALDIERTSVVHADSAGSNIIFQPNTVAQFYENAPGALTRPLVFNGGNVLGTGSANASVVDSPILLNGDITLQTVTNGVPNTTGVGTLTLNGPITETGGPHSITKVNGNAVALGGVNSYSGATNVNAGTLSVLNTGRIGTGALNVAAGAVSDFQSGIAVANKVAALSIAGGGTVDLHDNDLIVGSATSTGDVVNLIRAGRNNGAWDQPGLTSTEARTQANHATTLGALTGAEYTSTGGTVFSGQSYAADDTLVKYTWYGDTDFNGVVNFDDYVRADNGFNNHLTGWLNGDFDHNSVVNFDDYVLIDLAFNTQSGTLGRALAFVDGSDRSSAGMSDPALQKVEQHFVEFGEAYARGLLSAVPEPTTLALLGVPALAGLSRRRRRRSL